MGKFASDHEGFTRAAGMRHRQDQCFGAGHRDARPAALDEGQGEGLLLEKCVDLCRGVLRHLLMRGAIGGVGARALPRGKFEAHGWSYPNLNALSTAPNT